MKNRLTLPPVVMVPAIAFLIAGGAWWLLESTVPVGDFDVVVAQLDFTREELTSTRETLDDVVAQLDSAEEELASTREALDVVVAQLDATEEDLASTQQALSTEQSRLSQADPVALAGVSRPAALLLGYFAGADRSMVHGQAWDESWAGVVARDMAVEATHDPVLRELYWEYIDGDVGDTIDELASNEFLLRLVELTIEPFLRGQ